MNVDHELAVYQDRSWPCSVPGWSGMDDHVGQYVVGHGVTRIHSPKVHNSTDKVVSCAVY